MWYLILCFTLFLFLSKNTFPNKFISLNFLTYLIALETFPPLSLSDYIHWTSILLIVFVWCSIKEGNIFYLIDTLIVSSIKVLELSLLILPQEEIYLPYPLVVKLFWFDNIFLSGVITCLVLRETGYNFKVDTAKMKEYYLFGAVVILHLIAYVF